MPDVAHHLSQLPMGELLLLLAVTAVTTLLTRRVLPGQWQTPGLVLIPLATFGLGTLYWTLAAASPDVLAETEDLRVPFHFFSQGRVQGLPHHDLAHGGSSGEDVFQRLFGRGKFTGQGEIDARNAPLSHFWTDLGRESNNLGRNVDEIYLCK